MYSFWNSIWFFLNFSLKIPLKQLTNEEIELMKKVFVKLEIPFEVEWEQARLLSIFSRRKRKVGIILWEIKEDLTASSNYAQKEESFWVLLTFLRLLLSYVFSYLITFSPIFLRLCLTQSIPIWRYECVWHPLKYFWIFRAHFQVPTNELRNTFDQYDHHSNERFLWFSTSYLHECRQCIIFTYLLT